MKRFDRPIFIVAAPRSGSTLLFETLARSPSLWTIGGESHGLIEGIPSLNLSSGRHESNRLAAEHADEKTVKMLRQRFFANLRNRDEQPVSSDAVGLRLLEKTPKNALRIPFLDAAFPGALYIYLYRKPHENLSSIMEAWRSKRFVTYPKLTGWNGDPWSLLLIPEWQKLDGKPVEEIAAAQWRTTHEHIMNDLAEVGEDRWVGITYHDFLANPQEEMERLCRFTGLEWDQDLNGDLPHSRHTLTPPDPDKWKKNEAEINRVLPTVQSVADKVKQSIDASIERHQDTVADKPVIVKSPSSLFSRKPKDRKMTESNGNQAAAENKNGAKPTAEQPGFQSVHSTTFPQMLEQMRSTLAITTYQAGRLIFARADEGKLNTHFRPFSMPMGLAYKNGRMCLGTKLNVCEFRNQPAVAKKLEPKDKHDACFLPRWHHVTGDIRIHEIGFAKDELWLVNTRFSCLCTLDDVHSFVPQWRPPFVSGYAAEDRCHLNGLAIVDDKPRYVTCLGATDTVNGWRDNKAFGGILMDVESGEIISEGLSMPHSPRWYRDKLWVLESGDGNISYVDLKTGKLEVVAKLPGFTRGLDFAGKYAFIGLSQIRETAVFSGIPISERLKERTCGVWVVDLETGRIVALLRFEGAVQEIFAVQILPRLRYPDLILDDEKLLTGSFVLPDEAMKEVVHS